MIKSHNVHMVMCTIENCRVPVSYFCKREKHSINGAPRYRVFIIDPDGAAVYEKIFTTYYLKEAIVHYIETKGE